MNPIQAIILGVVEGLTEFLPVSSTGHLILTSHLLGLEGEATKTFEVIIQAGALLAVIGIYRKYILSMWRGLFGRDEDGRKLFLNLVVSFIPAAVFGVGLHKLIKKFLFGVWPVVFALAAGGLVMVIVDNWLRQRSSNTRGISSITFKEALFIGLAQCLALWPGTSRAMVTIIAGMFLGLSGTVAAEYSFLLALPTLGMATVFDFFQGGGLLLKETGVLAVSCGLISSAVVAALAIRGFIGYLAKRGLALFGWYRLALAVFFFLLLRA